MATNPNKDPAETTGSQAPESLPQASPDLVAILQKLENKLEAYEAKFQAQSEEISALKKAQTKAVKTASGPPEDSELALVRAREAYMNEKVSIKLAYDGKYYKDDVFVSVNGKAFQIRRGVEVEVPRYVAEVIDASLAQDLYAARLSERLERELEESERQFR